MEYDISIVGRATIKTKKNSEKSRFFVFSEKAHMRGLIKTVNWILWDDSTWNGLTS
jgi:hypothetical protein